MRTWSWVFAVALVQALAGSLGAEQRPHTERISGNDPLDGFECVLEFGRVLRDVLLSLFG